MAAGAKPTGRTVTAVTPGVDRLPVRLVEVRRLRRQVEGRAGDARSRSVSRRREQHATATIAARSSRVFEIAFFIVIALIAAAPN